MSGKANLFYKLSPIKLFFFYCFDSAAAAAGLFSVQISAVKAELCVSPRSCVSGYGGCVLSLWAGNEVTVGMPMFDRCLLFSVSRVAIPCRYWHCPLYSCCFFISLWDHGRPGLPVSTWPTKVSACWFLFSKFFHFYSLAICAKCCSFFEGFYFSSLPIFFFYVVWNPRGLQIFEGEGPV